MAIRKGMDAPSVRQPLIILRKFKCKFLLFPSFVLEEGIPKRNMSQYTSIGVAQKLIYLIRKLSLFLEFERST